MSNIMSNFEKNMEPIIAKEDMKISSEEKKASQDQDKELIANKEGGRNEKICI